ncbi:MAG: endolytic transglycosylase MltG [Pseudomonadota bacterium]
MSVLIRRLFLPTALLFVLMAGFAVWWLNQPLMMEGSAATEVTIDAGSSSKGAANSVAKASGASSALLGLWFRGASLVNRISGGKKPIRSGTYAIESNLSPLGMLRKLVSGDEIMLALVIPEGWTFAQMRAAINAAPSLKHTTANLSDAELMTALGYSGVLPEGRFFPDTYAYAKNASDFAIFKQAATTLDKRLKAAWNGRLQTIPLKNPDELLILASIVEKETGKPSDRAEIAGVFVNRLKIGMRLQTDPTVIYGMGALFAQQRNNIRRADLKRDTPYNTYTRGGLPPGPIALVGKAALDAAANPKETKALYFVARGDGSSQFSATLQHHNAAVNRFIRGHK